MMKAKITPATQFGNCRNGYNAQLHTVGCNGPIIQALIADGYILDFWEVSDEIGYSESVNVFSGKVPAANKAEYLKELRLRVKEIVLVSKEVCK